MGMTEQMAIEHIMDLAGDYKCYDERISIEESLILCKIIEEYQQYRAIGTVETIMTRLAMLEKYESIDTIENLQALKEKSVAKKPILVKRGFVQFYPCPNPNCSNPNKYMQVYPGQKYCVYCGQKLDWE